MLKRMVQVQVQYTGELGCQAVHGTSQATLNTDAPVDNQGRGLSFSPTDLTATSLGACMLTIIGIKARDHDLAIEGSIATVVKHMVSSPVRRISKLEVVIDVVGKGHDERARKVLHAAAMACPVKQSLHPDIEIVVDMRFAD